MKIEAGKYYKTRDGQKVGPIRARTGIHERYKWEIAGFSSYDDGGWDCDSSDCVQHIVAEWPDELAKETGPVRTETRKIIVPGDYDRIRVAVAGNPGFALVSFLLRDPGGRPILTAGMNATEFRAASDVFLALADALDGSP